MIDTRRYQWMIGGIGLVLVVAFSVYLYAHGGGHTHPGVPAGSGCTTSWRRWPPAT